MVDQSELTKLKWNTYLTAHPVFLGWGRCELTLKYQLIIEFIPEDHFCHHIFYPEIYMLSTLFTMTIFAFAVSNLKIESEYSVVRNCCNEVAYAT